ncbi:MAG: peptidylprolyl isomerase [Chthoniobacterales bacterium]
MFVLLAILGGFAVAELIYRAPLSRLLLARMCGLETEMSPLAENLRGRSSDQAVVAATVEREIDLLRDQFAGNEVFSAQLAAAGLSLGSLRALVAEQLRERAWIEAQIAPQLGVNENEAHIFYETHRAQFTEPPRFRAKHLFLAAPDGGSAEVVLVKQNAILGLSVRLLAGEDFVALVAEASEDERTKTIGGDLNYFAAERMPPEFIAEVTKLRVGQISAPFKSHLGFHLVQLTEAKPARDVSFAEARPEIEVSLGKTKRLVAVARLQAGLAQAR